MKKLFLVLFLSFSVFSLTASAGNRAKLKTENVIFIMTDGVRWHEAFKGADESLLNAKADGGAEAELAKMNYWRKTPEERREALMPFLWKIMAKNGQVFGNQDMDSVAEVTNGLNFSYPGYSETLCGVADPRVDSNKKINNPNMNVFEWLNGMRPFRGKIAAFGAWDLFPYILNRPRAGFMINAGYEPMTGVRMTDTYEVMNRLKEETIRYWHGEPFDSLTFETAREYFVTKKPRVFYLSLGETDEWAHEGRYDLYLESAKKADDAVRAIWELAQSMRKYRGKTTLIYSTDHGRGDDGDAWKGHGENVKGSEDIWMAFMGPDTPAMGERTKTERVTANQLAATLAALLGQDYCTAMPKAGKPIASVLSGASK